MIGAGPIGNLVAQMLARAGRDVTVFDREAQRLEALPAGVRGREEEIAGLGRFDTVVEATGNRQALEQVLAQAGVGARILLLGFPYGQTTYNFEDVVASDRAIVGSVGSGPADFGAAIEVLPELDLTPLTRAVYPLERYEEAWDAHRERAAVKVMLSVHP